jgi:glycerol-3-phosphate dehydrogenase
VYEALHERAVMMRNAPHLVHAQPFLLPTYSHWELPYYGAGLMLYDLMSGSASMGRTRVLGHKAAMARIPTLQEQGLSGGVLYYDGQFNDARLALALARTAADHGATILNYTRCVQLVEENERLAGAVLRDTETGKEYNIRAKVIFNAAGIFVDSVRTLDEPASRPLLTVSRGTHIVVGADTLAGETGIMVPKTKDGRVIFAIPWQGRVVIGTTDVAAAKPEMEPGHTQDEIGFLLETIRPYIAKPLAESDILSVFSGLRPLVTGGAAETSKLSREHHIEISAHGLITVAGGKWTTYRRMAEDAMGFAVKHQLLEKRACRTSYVAVHGIPTKPEMFTDPYLREYGSDAPEIIASMDADAYLAGKIDAGLPYTFAEVRYAVRFEMARTLEDVLSRRTRSLLLDSDAALRAAPGVAAVMAQELGRDDAWIEQQVAEFTVLQRLGYTLQR